MTTEQVCLYGSEPRTGAPAYLDITPAIWLDIFGLLGWVVEPWAGMFIGRRYDVTAICNAAPYAHMTDEQKSVLWNPATWPSIPEQFDREVMRWIWDNYAICSVGPNNCAADFDPESPGAVILDETNATILQEQAPGGGSIALVGHQSGGPSTSVTWAPPSGWLDGDLMVVAASADGTNAISTPSGWTLLGGEAHLNGWRGVFYRYGVVAGWVNPAFSNGGDQVEIVTWTLRGTHASAPFQGYVQAKGYPVTSLDLASINVTAGGWLLGGCHVRSSGNLDMTAPAGWTLGNSITYTNFRTAGARHESPATGETGVLTWANASNQTMMAWGVAIIPASSGMGDYYVWALDDSQAWAVGVPLPSESAPPYAYTGSMTDGYHIELRFPASLGGSGEEDELVVSFSNFDLSAPAGLTIPYATVLDVIAHPCAYVPSPTPPDEPPNWPADPYTATPATLAGIAAELDKMRDRLEGLTMLSGAILALLGDIYGPWEGYYGQAAEFVTGHLGVLTRDALRAMSNYHPTGYTETLEASGVTGDADIVSTARHYRIDFTTIPAWAGWRGGSKRVYDVNSRQQQLGWVQFVEGTNLLDNIILVCDNQHVASPVAAPTGLHIYLKPGVVASVYSMSEDYTPVLGA